MSANATFVFPHHKQQGTPPPPLADAMDLDPPSGDASASGPGAAAASASAPSAGAHEPASRAAAPAAPHGPPSDTSSPPGPSTPASVRDNRDVVLPSISSLLHERGPPASGTDRLSTPPEQPHGLSARGISTSPAAPTSSAAPIPVPGSSSRSGRSHGHTPARSWSGHEGAHAPWTSPTLPAAGNGGAGPTATPSSASRTSPSPLIRRAGGPGGSMRISRRAREQDFPPSARMHNEFVFPARPGKARAGGGGGPSAASATSAQLERITSESAATSRSNDDAPGSAAATNGDSATNRSPALSDSASPSSIAHARGPGSSGSGGLDILASVSASSEMAAAAAPTRAPSNVASATPVPLTSGSITPRRRPTQKHTGHTPSSASVAGSVDSRPTSPMAPSAGHHSRHPSGVVPAGAAGPGGTYVYASAPYPYPSPYPHHQRSTSLTSPTYARDVGAPYPYPPYPAPPPGSYVYPAPPPREGVPYPGPAQVPYTGPVRSSSYRRPRQRAANPVGLRRAGTVGHTHHASHSSVPVWSEWRDPSFGPPPPGAAAYPGAPPGAPAPPGVPAQIPAPGGGYWVHHPGPVPPPDWHASHRSVPSASTAASAADRPEGVSPPSSSTSLEGQEVPGYTAVAAAAAPSPASACSGVKRKVSGRSHRHHPSASSIDVHAMRMEQIRLHDRPDEEEADEDEQEPAYTAVVAVPATMGPGYVAYPPGAEAHAHAPGPYPPYPPPGYHAPAGVYPVPGGWVEAPYPPPSAHPGAPGPVAAPPDPRHAHAGGHLRHRSMNDMPRPGPGYYPPPPPPMFGREEFYAAGPGAGVPVRGGPSSAHAQGSAGAGGVGAGQARSTAPKYECQWCGKRFTRPSSLKIHNHVHTGEKPYVCDVPGCHRSFSVQSNLRRHQKSHPPPDPAAVAELIAHRDAGHQDEQSEKKPREGQDQGEDKPGDREQQQHDMAPALAPAPAPEDDADTSTSTAAAVQPEPMAA